MRDEKRRCDGCGIATSGVVRHRDDEGRVQVRYCPGCEQLRKLRGIPPGEHQQFMLKDETDASDANDAKDSKEA